LFHQSEQADQSTDSPQESEDGVEERPGLSPIKKDNEESVSKKKVKLLFRYASMNFTIWHTLSVH